MDKESKYYVGLRFGMITGLIYAVLLYIRYRFLAPNPIQFSLFAVVTYVIILTMYVFAGITRRRQLGGIAEMKDIFQSIFIVILITEFAFIVFNLVYLKLIDPLFWDNVKKTSQVYYQNKKLNTEQMEQVMKGFKDEDQQTKPMGLIGGYGYSVIVDSLFGFIIASVVTRKRKVNTTLSEKPNS
jgi:Protein of unknown function (DUF4199)